MVLDPCHCRLHRYRGFNSIVVHACSRYPDLLMRNVLIRDVLQIANVSTDWLDAAFKFDNPLLDRLIIKGFLMWIATADICIAATEIANASANCIQLMMVTSLADSVGTSDVK